MLKAVINTPTTTRSILTSTLIAISIATFGQTVATFKPFDAAKYPKEKYHLRSDTARFHNFEIVAHQVTVHSVRHEPGDTPCFAWLSIRRGEVVIKELYYNTLESVGSCYGIFMPELQPVKDLFFISIIGAYEGKFLVLDTFGNLNEYNGGELYISPDRHYLFSPTASDLSGLTVINLRTKKALFSGLINPYLGDWYFWGGNYFAEIWDFDHTVPNKMAKFNFKRNRIEVITVKRDFLTKAVKLKNFNVIERMAACNCGA